MSGHAPRREREVYHFGPFSLDTEARLLTRGGTEVPLTPKALDILLILLGNAGRAVPRTELLETVWPDAVVENGNLDWNVSALRRALGEVQGKAIETVRGFGYRFTGAVSKERVRTGPVTSIAPRPAEVAAAAAALAAEVPVVAVLPFDDLTRDPSLAWVSTAVSEVIGAELTAGRGEPVAREIVAAALAELKVSPARTLSPATLSRLRQRLGADLTVSGSFLVAGPERRLRLDATLQDCRTGGVLETCRESGTLDAIIELATGLGQRISQRLRG